MEIMPHLKLSDELNIKYAILPGDPARVDRIAEQLEQVESLAYNREYKSIQGLYKGVPVLAVSTGIGGPIHGNRSRGTFQNRCDPCDPDRKLRSIAEKHPFGRFDPGAGGGTG